MQVDVPPCEGEAAVVGCEKAVYSLLFMGGFDFANCNCNISCNFTIYDVETDTNQGTIKGKASIIVSCLVQLFCQFIL